MSKRHWALIPAAALAAAAFAAAAPAAISAAHNGKGGVDGRHVGLASGCLAGSASGRPADVATHGRGRAAQLSVAGPAETATAYLKARAAAAAADDPAAALSPWVVAGSTLALTEADVAAGTALRGRRGGRHLQSATCRVEILESTPANDGSTAVVAARAVVTLDWCGPRGTTDTEASGVDHRITLARRGLGWVVTADEYQDDVKAACLEEAGASRATIRRAIRRLERAATPLRLPSPRGPMATHVRSTTGVITYDRPSAQTYADRYALSYNPTFVHFDGADCANFASQCANAGHMPRTAGAFTSGWWYVKNGTSSPADDQYSWSWISVPRQMNFWNTRRTDWVASAGVLSRGDFIYYDWSGDGVWDHVAVVAGTNSLGQKIIDAHTTDLYHVFWKLGSSTTKYKYAKVRPEWPA